MRHEVEEKGLIERVAPEVWFDRIRRLDVLRDMVAMNIEKAVEKQEKYYNKGRRFVTHNGGNEVMRRVHVLSASKKFNKKLAPKYKGPFKFVEVESPTVYILDSAERRSRRLPMIPVSESKRNVPPRKTRSEKHN